jgi:hypothetical protein
MAQCDRFQQQRGAGSWFAASGYEEWFACRHPHAPQAIARRSKPPINSVGSSFEEPQEGVSIRAISRMTGASKNTIVKLLADAGNACSEYQDRTLRNLPCKRIQADEIWSFVYSKQKNVPKEKRRHFGIGDVWTWTTICADTKLVPSWYVGMRDAESAHHIMQDVAKRLTNHVQLTTDGFTATWTQLTRHSDRTSITQC